MHTFVDIVPLVAGNPQKSVFTYSCGDFSLQPGMLVRVPYGNQEVTGLVIRLHDDPVAFSTKMVMSLVYPTPVLPPHLIQAAQFMSSYYFASLRSCVMSVLLFRKAVRLSRKNMATVHPTPVPSLILRDEQQTAVDAITSALGTFQSFLLYGVTGSGKTEVYLRVIESALARNQQVIYLVPEISLTPQTIARVEARFPNSTVVITSRLSSSERYAAFLDCVHGTKPIVIGSRSALFAPLFSLGLIIIDEFHDHSYKQETVPQYYTPTVADFICRSLAIPMVLGSATPCVDYFFRATSPDYPSSRLLSLSQRAANAVLPYVHIVDMREELRKGNFSHFSDTLQEALARVLRQGEQAVLFLNKRGTATTVICRLCGWTAVCPRCSISLTLHAALYNFLHNKLVCHHCGFMRDMVSFCESCKSSHIKAMGLGTERIEKDLLGLFPHARVIRMDRDTTSRKGSHEVIYRSFVDHEYDILVGTQMISKGWDIPNVTLVGIMNADTILHMPYYSAAEQTFALLTQVSGRAGRGKQKGVVVLQTYHPSHYAIVAAANHSYTSFFEKEIAYRKQLHYPPFSHLAQLVIADFSEEKAFSKAQRLFSLFETHITHLSLDTNFVHLLGPSRCLIPKLRNKWYYQILIKGTREVFDALLPLVPSDWKITIDPMHAV